MTVIHEKSYRGLGLPQLVHRSRLRRILRLVDDLDLPARGSLADVGCSNGFVLSQLKEHVLSGKDYALFGFDHSDELLRGARNKNIDGASFHRLDLNEINTSWRSRFDVITCFETLEHVGNYRHAMQNIVAMCRPHGMIVLSIPNERGVPGLLKYVARKLLRKEAYGEFFARQSEWDYVRRLLFNLPIDSFRNEGASGWGPHLGFDWKVFREHLERDYFQPQKLRLISEQSSFMNFNLFYVMTKLDAD